MDLSLLNQGLCTRHALVESTHVFQTVGSGIYVQIPPEASLDPKDLLLDDALVYLRRSPVCDIVLNLIKSSLMGKIQDQSVITYVLDSLSVLTLATVI
jgi:hypothetical protein